MADNIPTRISYKSQIRPQSFVSLETPGYPIAPPLTKYAKHSPSGPISRRTESYDVTTAASAATQLDDWSAQIAENHGLIEQGLRYHGNLAFARTFDLYAKCRNALGGRVQVPSLPVLLDLQEETLGNYARCLDQITRYVDAQHGIVKAEVDVMDKQLGQCTSTIVREHMVALRSQLAQAQTHGERRELTDQLYEQDRLSRSLADSQTFFDQYVGQESTLRDVGHSLRLLTDQTVLFERYISTSKGFFVTVSGIGQVVAHMSPVVAKMKTQTMQLQDNVGVVTSFLSQRSAEPLFPRKSPLTHSQG